MNSSSYPMYHISPVPPSPIFLVPIQEELLNNYPGVSCLPTYSFDIVMKYLEHGEYSRPDDLSITEWYEKVHTFLLLVLESEGA
jgi:hypothetical protein